MRLRKKNLKAFRSLQERPQLGKREERRVVGRQERAKSIALERKIRDFKRIPRKKIDIHFAGKVF